MKLVYDVKAVPQDLGIANMIKIFEQHRVVFWNSDNGIKPKFFSNTDEEAKVAIVDTTGVEIDFEQYQREFDQQMFWDKELHNCKNSPVYYFTHYGTTVYPATNKGTSLYLKSIGLTDIKVTDSAKASAAWEKQKGKVKEAMAGIKVDHLIERKAALDILKSDYEGRIIKLEQDLKNDVILFDGTGAPLPVKKRLSNIVGKLKFLSTVPPEQFKTYRNRKRRWDTAMLLNTNYDVLLGMLKTMYELHEATSGK